MANEDLGGLTRRELFSTVYKGAKAILGIKFARKIGLPLEARANSLFVELNDENYKREILDYEGPALTLFYDSNFERFPASKHEFEAIKAVARQYGTNGLEKFNGRTIKFGLFDISQYNRNPSTKNLSKEQKWARLKERYGYPTESAPVTFMYINGRVIDIKVGGPTFEKDIQTEVDNISKFWIPYNITNPREYTYLYQRGSRLIKHQRGS